ncbi:MAG: chemotaxis protein CheB, partial [Deferribacterales bacterium]
MKDEKLILVGIGASAGGLEALKLFIPNIEPNGRIAYVVVQHLSPSHKSMLTSLLSKDSKLEIAEIKDSTILKPDVVYITPPNFNVAVKNGVLRLNRPQDFVGPKPSVDQFFISMSEDETIIPCGVILSGTGSDGSTGIRAIKAAGGITIAQETESAKYDGMPHSAIETGNVDITLTPEKIASEIAEIFLNSAMPEVPMPEPKETVDHFKTILTLIKRKKGTDFRDYKENTLKRRIQRRMAARKFIKIKDYVEFLKNSPEETEQLFFDILINVTAFFRDQEAFAELRKELDSYINSDRFNDSLRFWIVGCSTGEEVYSITIILAELLGDKLPGTDIQIFATDIDTAALNIARKGFYPESAITEIDPSLVKKYFIKHGSTYEVVKTLREMVIFSRHDIASDPPFIRIDFISCRNLLIYFNADLQRKVFESFYYSLNPGGILMLGKSESTGNIDTHFETADKKNKLYRLPLHQKKVTKQIFPRIAGTRYQETAETHSESDFETYIRTSRLEEFFSAFAVTDLLMNIFYLHGNISEYINLPTGKPKINLSSMICKTFRPDVRVMIQRLKNGASHAFSPFRKMGSSFVRSNMRKMMDGTQDTGFILLYFESIPEDELPGIAYIDDSCDMRISEIQSELANTKQDLQTVIEELETSNEELQSLNEELHSSNEELQSSNEELETTNEELQATNEELNIAYNELKALYEEREQREKLLLEKTALLTESENTLKALNKTLEARVEKEVAQRLQSELFITKIFETAEVGICLTDSKGRFVKVNKAYLQIYGYTEEELLGKPFTIVVPDNFRETALHMHNEFISGKLSEIPAEWEVVNKSGKSMKIISTASRVELGGKIYKITSVTDITNIKRIEEEQKQREYLLIQQSKLAAIGEMVASISHQWKQPLNSLYQIFQYIDSALSTETPEEAVKSINEVAAESRQIISFMDDTINTFKNFFKLKS